jgi:hypothetical protein
VSDSSSYLYAGGVEKDDAMETWLGNSVEVLRGERDSNNSLALFLLLPQKLLDLGGLGSRSSSRALLVRVSLEATDAVSVYCCSQPYGSRRRVGSSMSSSLESRSKTPSCCATRGLSTRALPGGTPSSFAAFVGVRGGRGVVSTGGLREEVRKGTEKAFFLLLLVVELEAVPVVGVGEVLLRRRALF